MKPEMRSGILVIYQRIQIPVALGLETCHFMTWDLLPSLYLGLDDCLIWVNFESNINELNLMDPFF